MKRFTILSFLFNFAICSLFAQEAQQHSDEAEQLLQCLRSVEGQKTISGTMACVNWNLNEAKWVHQHTGKWPALNGFDYIHHPFSSKGGWIDYTNISELSKWNSEGGVVTIMWHWNVPANKSGEYSFYWGTEADKTTFDVRKIFEPKSSEYKLMMKDIDQIASYLKLLKNAKIPVLWRPLHEAGGMWFWWGRDPDACNELWRTMYRRFQKAGLDNLIWVWTQSAAWGKPYSDGYRWYPGDEYVDIVSIDVYNNNSAANIYTSCYKFLCNNSPTKFVALTECGNVPTISKQWSAGCKWLFFMPWYDYGRTNSISSSEFMSTSHSNCNAAWWKEAFKNDFVLTRDDMKALRQQTAGISPTVGRRHEEGTTTGEVFDLRGRRVTSPSRGIYIVNGKKTLIQMKQIFLPLYDTRGLSLRDITFVE